MSDTLRHLAAVAGIEESYWDIFGTQHVIDDPARRFLLASMGIAADSEDVAAQSLRNLEDRPWLRLVPPVVVARGDHPPTVEVCIPEELGHRSLKWSLRLETGEKRTGETHCTSLPTWGSRDVKGQRYLKKSLRLPGDLPLGYHQLEVELAGKAGRGTLIMAPDHSYRPSWLTHGERKWGLACHLYAPRHATDWGIGDFTTLQQIIRMGLDQGAHLVGLNPLHALFPANPEHASPYSPSSRLFLNPLFIDLEAVPEFEAVRQSLPAHLSAQLNRARQASHVDYGLVSEIKTEVFAALFRVFRSRKGPRWEAFDAFRAELGQPLETFCLFEALTERFDGKSWTQWPKGYHSPDTPTVRQFARDHAERITYHAYLQWLADSQLAAAAQAATDGGMDVGLYRDLAVGVDPNGAEAWCDQKAIAIGVQFGAPGDALNPVGQAWGAPPYLPLALREMAYAPFIAVLRANMRHAGALRIDHAMALQHLFWIPNGADARSGAYVSYNMDEMLAIVALESTRQRCLVIGEDLGTVPEGFQPRMNGESVLSYRVLYFERWNDGLFKRPDAYPRLSLATPTTHDLPTLLGHWRGNDLALRRKLGQFASEEQMATDEANRETDRKMMISALTDQGLLPANFPSTPDLSPEDGQRLLVAVHRFVARTDSALALIGIDDLAAEMDQLNLPGTVDEYPNWRRRITPTIEELSARPQAHEITQGARAERG
ncbi:4-alpha-glucanotransferase [Magnetospira thiophila]